MKTPMKFVILGLVVLGAVGALALRAQRDSGPAAEKTLSDRPRIVELGGTTCKACQAMHLELEEFTKQCGASIGVEVIDVWKDEAAGQRYKVSAIPTQVLLDAKGREIDRHTGFLSVAEIRARFSKRGMECRP